MLIAVGALSEVPRGDAGDWAYIRAFPGALAMMFSPTVGIHVRKRSASGFDVEMDAQAAAGTLAKSRHARTNTEDCPGLSRQLALIPQLAAGSQAPPPRPPAPDSGSLSLTYLADKAHPITLCCGGEPVGVWGDAILKVLEPCWRDVGDEPSKGT